MVQKLPVKGRDILLICAYGLGGGLAAVGFQKAINFCFESTYLKWALDMASGGSLTQFLIGSFLLIMGTSLAVGWLLHRHCREASGSGIPQLKLAFWKDFGVVSWRVVWVKFVAGVLSIGGGCSLGREGPSVQLAGGLASNLAERLGVVKQQRRLASAAGAAAGLAAAFNTPIAAVTFVLEEIVQDLNSRLLGGILLASVLGAFVVHGMIGMEPAFSLQQVGTPAWKDYVLTPVVATVAALAGVLFQQLTLALRRRRKEFTHVPAWVRPSLGALATWILGVSVFLYTGRLGVFGLGYHDLSAALNQELAWHIAGLLLFAKLAATFLCYGFGNCGGIFSPTLFFGGMCGLFLSGLFGMVFDLQAADHTVLAVVGMSACLSAVVRAPVTGILIVFEMTHDFSLVPALMLGALVSVAVSRRFSQHNFYDALLLQDGHNLEHVIPPRDLQSWQQLPVSAIANFQPITVPDLEPVALKKLLKTYPYRRFPVVQDGKITGMLTRVEIEAALTAERPPKLEPASTCIPTRTIRQLQALLIESSTGLVVIVDRPNGKALGLITLHDLLRTQASIAKGAES